MPAKRKTVKRVVRTHKKHVSEHPKHFLKVYWPYIPLILLVVVGMFYGGVKPSSRINQPATLAYSTEMSVSGLLNGTNTERANNGLPALTINTQLNNSAQLKANDMVSKDYWAHNTPSGQEPWVFFDTAGYLYQKAGENLAYGFATSADAIIGWMNSPSHRANILDGSYTEVGFGFTNAENFVTTGQETVVVAHYGKPLYDQPVAPAQSTPDQPTILSESDTQSPVNSEPVPVATAAPVEAEPEIVSSTPQDTTTDLPDEVAQNTPITSDTPVPSKSVSTNITRLQSITKGNAIWSAAALSLLTLVLVAIWLFQHALLVKRFVLRGEHFVAHHPVIDLLVVAIVAAAIYLSQTSGVVI